MTNAALPSSNSPSRRSRWIIAVGVAALVGLACYGTLRALRSASSERSVPAPEQTDPDPRRAANTPYLNVRPDVAYVGDEACASCHVKYVESYRHHPMGRSLRPVADLPADTRPEGNPFNAMGLQFRIERRGSQVVHRELLVGPDGRVLAQTEAPVRYALGSGTRAISYLIDHEGTLTQSPITWFEQTKSWDMSPGFKGAPDRFERPILASCLFCHCNLAEPDADTRSAYRSPIFHQGYSIGCERCHGPGALHVKAQQSGQEVVVGGHDVTIVNPSRLEPALQEAVCAQCHLGGKERVLRRGRGAFDFRPGLPLESFYRIFVLPPDLVQGNRVAGHLEQIHVSRCFQKSAGKLACTTCHDAHSVPDPKERETYYRDQCLQCHHTESCTETLARRHSRTKTDDCTVCHMPQQATDISHVALTDHRIRRRPDPHQGPPPEPDPLLAILSLLPFDHDRVDGSDRELLRDLAIASIVRARSQAVAVRMRVSRDFTPLLAEAVRAYPDDLSARESLAVSLAWQGQLRQALAECEEILARVPRRELALTDAGVISQQMELADKSLAYWQRALEVNPWSTRYRFAMAKLLSMRDDWDKAAAESRRILAQNGDHIFSRLLLLEYYLRNRKTAEARAELETVLALHPPNEAQLRQRFADLLR
jgi:predicted CXXCH cytochrome family protein